MRTILLLAIGAVLVSCSASTPTPTATPTVTPAPTASPTAASPTADNLAFAEATCAGTTYEQCVDSIIFAIEVVEVEAGTLAAICEYEDGQGDVVLHLEGEDEAEARCSADGAFFPSRVFATFEMPG